ncbi:MAG: SsrA-binding protein SmpB [Bacilli bacterium]|nr:SsrA-binding protein SmpB [Bacilli bacterium]
MKSNGTKIIAVNRKASYEYFLLETYEAGLVLFGSEIKSIRRNSCNIKEAYVNIRNNEAYIINMHISEYKEANIFNHDPYRTRKLLLHKKEIIKLGSKIKEEGITLIPTKLYLKDGKAKLEFALAKGKKLYDKRDDAKQKSMAKEARKYAKEKF